MRVDAIPKRLIILGGGYIAAEIGHVFGALGSHVTIINRSDRLLRAEDTDVSRVFTEQMGQRFDLHLDSSVQNVAQDPDGEIVVSISSAGQELVISGDTLLVATGRTPNGADLGVTATGVELDQSGYVVADDQGRTAVEGIWALGDITSPEQLKHTANAESRVVAHNLTHPDDLISADMRYIPHAVFGSPQVASVGPTEAMLIEAETPHRSIVRYYRDAAYGWAMEDTTSLVKLIADPAGERLLAAHIVGPQASTLIQQLIMGMAMDLSIEDMARRQLYIHPALPEVIEQALLEFG
jgi:mycothione reductase